MTNLPAMPPIRRASDEDVPAILDLAARSLGWVEGEPNASFFGWKHHENPFGPSPMWVATDAGRVVGFRTFLRWEWRSAGGSIVPAVRAVDTATDPAYQGRGIFTGLTTAALAELQAEGVRFVFNTPNDRSRPGYLKMGWRVVGSVPLSVRVGSFGGARRLLTARRPAEKWAAGQGVGDEPAVAFEDGDALATLVGSQPVPRMLATATTVAYLRWRFGFGPLGYRIFHSGRVEEGFVAYRLRRRGQALEATVCEVLAPGGDTRRTRQLLADLASATAADYLVRVSRRWVGPGPWIRVPRLGPVLTWRGVRDTIAPELTSWDLSLGDIELF